MSEAGDNVVILYNIPIGRILEIVHELKTAQIEFSWEYVPPVTSLFPVIGSDNNRKKSAVFTFTQASYTAWFQLKYG